MRLRYRLVVLAAVSALLGAGAAVAAVEATTAASAGAQQMTVHQDGGIDGTYCPNSVICIP